MYQLQRVSSRDLPVLTSYVTVEANYLKYFQSHAKAINPSVCEIKDNPSEHNIMNSDEDYLYNTETILEDLVLPSEVEQGPSGVKRRAEDTQGKEVKTDNNAKDSILCQLLQ